MRRLAIGLVLLTVGVLATSCFDDSTSEKQRKEAVQTRTQMFDQAEKMYPVPQMKSFPIRKDLVEFTKRQDQLNHPWYVYVLGENGNAIGYYVAKSAPQNACNYLSSTQDVHYDSDGNVVLTAPSLNGVYQGGGGAASACDVYFFFDAATNAVVQIEGLPFWVSDQPLKIDAEPITVSAK